MPLLSRSTSHSNNHALRAHRLALAALSALAFTTGASQAADLTVKVTGAKSTQGAVNVALFTSADGWTKTEKMFKGERLPAALPKTVLVFKDVPPGRYALSAYHDENGNEKLDTNMVGLPVERYGFSRDARGRMGPPSFDEAVIDVTGDMNTAITLK